MTSYTFTKTLPQYRNPLQPPSMAMAPHPLLVIAAIEFSVINGQNGEHHNNICFFLFFFFKWHSCIVYVSAPNPACELTNNMAKEETNEIQKRDSSSTRWTSNAQYPDRPSIPLSSSNLHPSTCRNIHMSSRAPVQPKLTKSILIPVEPPPSCPPPHGHTVFLYPGPYASQYPLPVLKK